MLGEGFLKLKTNINRDIKDLIVTAKKGKGTISILAKYSNDPKLISSLTCK